MRNRLTITKTTTALATSALLVLGLAACGGSGDDTSTDSETTTSAEESTDATEETTDPEVTEEETTDEDMAEDDAAADGDFCAAFATLSSAQDEMSSLDPNDLGAAVDTFDQFTTTLEDAEAPAEVASDWDAVAAGFRSLTDTLETAKDDPANADPSSAMAMLSDESFMTSLQNVATYGATNC
ncbi:hypothetical protein IF650_04020 [Cellulosimicrobium terreum]|nr:hypothetical protein [Cellulosimicrobium terreum]